MTFYVGQKVVCVDDDAHHRYMPRGMIACDGDMDGLIKGTVYTVRSIGMFNEVPVCRLKELIRPVWFVIGQEGWFARARFRPVVEPKTEVSFTMGADPHSERWDNRRSAPAEIEN